MGGAHARRPHRRAMRARHVSRSQWAELTPLAPPSAGWQQGRGSAARGSAPRARPFPQGVPPSSVRSPIERGVWDVKRRLGGWGGLWQGNALECAGNAPEMPLHTSATVGTRHSPRYARPLRPVSPPRFVAANPLGKGIGHCGEVQGGPNCTCNCMPLHAIMPGRPKCRTVPQLLTLPPNCLPTRVMLRDFLPGWTWAEILYFLWPDMCSRISGQN